MDDILVSHDTTFRSDMTVELIDSMGDDASVVAAARVSTRRSYDAGHYERILAVGDDKLIEFLMRNRHGTPFEHNAMTFYVEAPIFVFREFHRHRIGFSYNETSGRYRELDAVCYSPGPDRPLVQQGKPGHYTFVAGDPDQYAAAVDLLTGAQHDSFAAYHEALALGVAKEVARIVLPVGTYSAMYVTCNARSMMAFLSLRTKHPDSTFPSFPQREIEMVAEKMELFFADLFPVTYRQFVAAGRVSP